MSDEKLKLVETCALLILMIEAREVPNTFLTKEVRLTLTPASRDRLVRLGLIEVRKEGQRVFLNLTDDGWRQSLHTMGTDLPPNAGVPGATIYRLVATLRHFLRASGFAAAEFFVPQDSKQTEAVANLPKRKPSTLGIDDVAALIRKTYGNLAKTPGESVELTRIRAALGDISRSHVDAALIDLSSFDDVRIFPESNQKTLTADDRAASVSIGNQDKHLIAIDS